MSVYCGIAISARNEGERIRRTLKSIREQTVSTYIVVVNDGSTDDTGEIARELADEVIDMPYHEESHVAKPELAVSFNVAFKALENIDPKYIMVSGGDVYYQKNYVELLTRAMSRDGVVIASGLVRGEEYDTHPRGAGRIYESKWFKKNGYAYPVTYGFESTLLYKALAQSVFVATYNVLFDGRATKKNKIKIKSLGASMKSLNYWWFYALLRCVQTMIKDSLSDGLLMLYGYLFINSYVCEDLKEYMHKTQKRRLKNMLLFRNESYAQENWLREL